MNNIKLSTSDIIQLIGIIATLFTSLTAIVISIVSLRKNSKMIEESSRGYVTIYSAITNWDSPNNYFIIKNFGNSSATIIEFESDYDLTKLSYFDDYSPFYKIIGTTLAPNESLKYNIDFSNVKNLHEISISIKYKTLNKIYADTISINIDAISTVVYSRSQKKNPESEIVHVLQDISEKML